jgi:hypothetical protein
MMEMTDKNGEGKEFSKATIRAVKVLEGELKEMAEQQNLEPNDIVVVKKSKYNSEPNYKIEKINGSVVEYLKKQGLAVKE